MRHRMKTTSGIQLSLRHVRQVLLISSPSAERPFQLACSPAGRRGLSWLLQQPPRRLCSEERCICCRTNDGSACRKSDRRCPSQAFRIHRRQSVPEQAELRRMYIRRLDRGDRSRRMAWPSSWFFLCPAACMPYSNQSNITVGFMDDGERHSMPCLARTVFFALQYSKQ